MESYEVTLRSVIGTREDQQDYALLKEKNDGILTVVCDGMGGLEGGQLASRTAADQLIELFEKWDEQENIREFFLNNVDILDEKVFSLIDLQGDRLNAGTTLVSTYLKGNKLDWLSVGDSRLYIIRGREIVRATRDHNYKLTLDDMLSKGRIKPEEYAVQIAKGEALISYIGIGGIEVMDLSKYSLNLQKDDYVLSTSDGLYKILSDDDIKRIISGPESLEEKADALINFANEHSNGVQDNTTFILMKIC